MIWAYTNEFLFYFELIIIWTVIMVIALPTRGGSQMTVEENLSNGSNMGWSGDPEGGQRGQRGEGGGWSTVCPERWITVGRCKQEDDSWCGLFQENESHFYPPSSRKKRPHLKLCPIITFLLTAAAPRSQIQITPSKGELLSQTIEAGRRGGNVLGRGSLGAAGLWGRRRPFVILSAPLWLGLAGLAHSGLLPLPRSYQRPAGKALGTNNQTAKDEKRRRLQWQTKSGSNKQISKHIKTSLPRFYQWWMISTKTINPPK